MGDGRIYLARADVDAILRATADMPHNNVLLYGPPGTGKSTEAVECAKPQQETVIVPITEEMSATAVVGHFLVRGGETIFHDNAPGLYAMDNGLHLVLDEIDKASGDLVDVLYVVLADRERCRFRLASGREVRAKEPYRVVATTNADPDDLPEALRDRFAIILPLLRPAEAATVGWDDDAKMALARSYDAVESHYMERENDRPAPLPTYRQLRNFTEFRGTFGDDVAALMVTGKPNRAAALVELLGLMRAEKLRATAEAPAVRRGAPDGLA